MQKLQSFSLVLMKNDIRNLYWPGLYNVKFVHNCSGSMLEATRRTDKYTNFRPRQPLYSGWLQLDVLMHAKRRKVHADDNGAVVLLTNCTSFISIFLHLNDTSLSSQR